MKPTETVAQFIVGTSLADVPSGAQEAAKTAILDTIGVSLAAASQPIGQIITRYVRTQGGVPIASVIGSAFRTSAPLAALANGTLAHGLDYDDRGHVSTHTVPASLAVGELVKASGAQVLEAYIVGREVGVRLADTLFGSGGEAHDGPTGRGWHHVGVIGTMAAAAAAAKLLRLDLSATRTALGIAASCSAGLRQSQGTMTKPYHAGNAAFAGVNAACLAQAGFTADEEILEAPLGLASALCRLGEVHWEHLERLGRPFELERPINVKPFPACSPSHKPIDATLEIRRQHTFSFHDIVAIDADLHLFSLYRNPPRDGTATGFSLPYLLAVALIDGQVGVDQKSSARASDLEVRALMELVRDAPGNSAPDGSEKVVVHLRDGRALEATVKRRNLTRLEEIQHKFEDCAGRVLASEQIGALWELGSRLEQVEEIGRFVGVAMGADGGNLQGELQQPSAATV